MRVKPMRWRPAGEPLHWRCSTPMTGLRTFSDASLRTTTRVVALRFGWDAAAVIPGMRGTLLSPDALARHAEPSGCEPVTHRRPARNSRSFSCPVEHEAGPPGRRGWCSTGSRSPSAGHSASTCCRAEAMDGPAAALHRDGAPAAVVIAFPFGQEPGSLWRDSVRAGIGAGVRWCYCFTGPACVSSTPPAHTRDVSSSSNSRTWHTPPR